MSVTEASRPRSASWLGLEEARQYLYLLGSSGRPGQPWSVESIRKMVRNGELRPRKANPLARNSALLFSTEDLRRFAATPRQRPGRPRKPRTTRRRNP